MASCLCTSELSDPCWSPSPSPSGNIESNELNVTEGKPVLDYLPIQGSDTETGVTRVTFIVSMLVVTQYYRGSLYDLLSHMHQLNSPLPFFFSLTFYFPRFSRSLGKECGESFLKILYLLWNRKKNQPNLYYYTKRCWNNASRFHIVEVFFELQSLFGLSQNFSWLKCCVTSQMRTANVSSAVLEQSER